MAGATYYKGLTVENKTLFIETLRNQLANIVPVNPSRFVPNSEAITDSGFFLLFRIEASNESTYMSSAFIARNLNILITFRDITAVSKMNATALIDDKYGFQIIGTYLFLSNTMYLIGTYLVTFYFVVSVWDQLKFILIGAAILICILGGLIFYAYRKFPEVRKNFISFAYVVYSYN